MPALWVVVPALLALAAAIGPPAPYPPSPVITGITWAPASTIVRKAHDSDIWATTWADDGRQYTAYGDGTGFVPKVPRKLSQGLARIEGGPSDFTGVNLRSDSFERTGDGARGPKASGLLMVGGVLYAWVRNTGNAQLAWSTDHGRTWTWADWKFTPGFGCPTFLNFGPDYAGARDDFVYVYSHDADSAYVPADRVALARVPKGRLRERAAYEFFQSLGPTGPVWTADVAARGGVFTHAGRCYRVTVSYNAGLRRYLLCQAGDDRRTEAGFGIFDAPEPWGPWTTVTWTPAWDVAAGETCSFPTKWMSADGKTLHLVFSGGDCFAVRQATLGRLAEARGSGLESRLQAVRGGPAKAGTPTPAARHTATQSALKVAAQSFAWQTVTPESQGMSAAKLDALRDELAKRKTAGFLVVRNDRVVYEWYAPGHSATKTHYTASAAKALVGGVATAVALTDGRLALHDRVSRFVPEWQADPRKAKIEIRHLGSHTSGLDDAEENGLPHDRLTGWRGDFWKRLPPPDDPFTIARDRVPLVAEPGAQWHYSNPGIGMLTYAVTAALRDAPQKDVRTLLRDRVMRPIGVPDAEWSVGYGQTVTLDGLPLVAAWGGGGYTARAAARVGRLMLRGGDWDGTRILSPEAVRQTTTTFAGLPGDVAVGWWTNNHARHPNLQRDAFWAAGAGDQLVLVVPSLSLIVVRNGAGLASRPGDDRPGQRLLFEGVLAAVAPR